MWGWKRKTKEVDNLQSTVVESFEHVRKDVHNIHEWLRFLHQQNLFQQQVINDLKDKLGQVEHKPDVKTQVHKSIDTHPKFDILHTRLAMLEEKLGNIVTTASNKEDVDVLIKQVKDLEEKLDKASVPQVPRQPINPIPTQQFSQRIAPQMPMMRHSALTAKVAKSVSKHSKEYIKQAIAGMINKYDSISGLQLREMLVDEQQLCSRSTFYRLLGELEMESGIGCTPNGKEKIYSSAIQK